MPGHGHGVSTALQGKDADDTNVAAGTAPGSPGRRGPGNDRQRESLSRFVLSVLLRQKTDQTHTGLGKTQPGSHAPEVPPGVKSDPVPSTCAGLGDHLNHSYRTRSRGKKQSPSWEHCRQASLPHGAQSWRADAGRTRHAHGIIRKRLKNVDYGPPAAIAAAPAAKVKSRPPVTSECSQDCPRRVKAPATSPG